MNSHHQKGQNITFTPNTKASIKEHKVNKKKKFSPFMSKIVRVDELSKLANNRVVLFWKKRSTKFGFVYIYISIVKINIISKFVLATNNIMYVQQSEPKMEIKQR